jgi:pyruvate dehydrogenase E2 component (dihydrolipoyllysine-residue acetyltransferase)
VVTKVIVPKVDMDQEAGTIVEWLRGEGDRVEQGEIILVIETDKVAIDVEAPVSGILQGISAQPGDVLPIGTEIALILAPGEKLPGDARPPAAIKGKRRLPERYTEKRITPLAEKIAVEKDIDLSQVVGTGVRRKITKQDIEKVIGNISERVVSDNKVFATPKARRLAHQSGINLSLVSGKGPFGRIQAADVMAIAAKGQSRLELVSSPQDEVIPLHSIRLTIIERMTASIQNIPHISLTSRMNMSRFIETRKTLNTPSNERGNQKVSTTALIVKLVSKTLRQHPFLNSSLKDDAIILHKDINIGIAVALENGLIVPVIKNTQSKSVMEIAVEVNDLVDRARAGKLNSADVRNGTFTISNLGPFGIEQFEAIINPPEAAILAIGAIQIEALSNEDEQIVSCPIMRITLSADHRIVDGAVAALFLADLKIAIEDPILSTL